MRSSVQLQLADTESPSRLLALLRERDRLLQQAARKRKALESLRDQLQRVEVAVGAQVGPLVARMQTLDAEVHARFREILTSKRLDRRGRRQVEELYACLQTDGVISEARDDEPELLAEDDDTPFGNAREARPGPSSGHGETVAGATKPGASSVLKSLFRKLAVAMHPDRAQDEAERVRRTEVMKEVSRAYEDDDVARLLELERAWLAGESFRVDEPVDETTRRCAELERLIDGLCAQMKRLDGETRELRRSPPAVMSRALGLRTKGKLEGHLADLKAQGDQGVRALTELRDFTTSFRDGRISLKAFLEGPQGAAPDEDGGDGFEGAMMAAMQELFGAAPQPPQRRRKRR